MMFKEPEIVFRCFTSMIIWVFLLSWVKVAWDSWRLSSDNFVKISVWVRFKDCETVMVRFSWVKKFPYRRRLVERGGTLSMLAGGLIPMLFE